MKTPTQKPVTANSDQETEQIAEHFPFRKAFHATATDRAALRPEELVHLAFDVSLATQMVLATVSRVQAYEAEIRALPLDHQLLARLDQYAQAAGYAQARYNAVNAAPEELKATYEQAVEYRATLYSDATNLVRHRVLNDDALHLIKNEVGFRNVGFDLMTLVSVFRDAAARIKGRTATLPADLDQAEAVANQLLFLTARREQRQLEQPDLGDERLRAVSLMVRAYQQTRRAIQFVRFDYGDAERIAPSIYTARSARKREDVIETPNGDSVVVPLPNAPAVTQAPVPVGAPGGNPFM